MFVDLGLSGSFFFFFNDPATTEIYTLSLHDALPISRVEHHRADQHRRERHQAQQDRAGNARDRKSTRLNSSHGYSSYAVFCTKTKTRFRTHPCKATQGTSRNYAATYVND